MAGRDHLAAAAAGSRPGRRPVRLAAASSWREMELANGDLPARPMRTQQLDLGVERGERNGRVGGVHRDAVVGPAEDRVPLVEAVERRAAGARLALVAGATAPVAEIGAAGPLQQVAADRRHVADLRRGAGEQRLAQTAA